MPLSQRILDHTLCVPLNTLCNFASNTLCNFPSGSLFRQLSNEDEKAFKKLLAMETRLSWEEWNSGPGIDADKVYAVRYLLV